MIIAIIALILIVCALVIALVLIQNSKGGGLASNMAGSQFANSMMGSRKAADFAVKGTWYLMGLLVVLTFVANMLMGGTDPANQQGGDERTRNAKVNTTPTQPMSVPQGAEGEN
ncbi:MAG: preprotein translocase subunit SecG [Bacteroidetes bacterium]|nr:preprotein translocase subunit SecG [Bacteroidota bacterium]